MRSSLGLVIGIATCLFACTTSSTPDVPGGGAGTEREKPPASSKTPTQPQPEQNKPTPQEEKPAEKTPASLDGSIIAISVDGVKATPTKLEKSSDTVGGIKRYHARIFFTPTGGAEEQIHLITYTAASGCFTGSAGDATTVVQGVEYKSGGNTFETPGDDFSCGLIVSEAGDAKIAGSFAGQVSETNEGPAAPVTLAVQFDIPMTK